MCFEGKDVLFSALILIAFTWMNEEIPILLHKFRPLPFLAWPFILVASVSPT